MSCNTATVALWAAAVLRWWLGLVPTISIMRTLSFSAASSTLLPARNTGTSVWQTLHHPRHRTDKGYCKSCILGLTDVQWTNKSGVSASFSFIQPYHHDILVVKKKAGQVSITSKKPQSVADLKWEWKQWVLDANTKQSPFTVCWSRRVFALVTCPLLGFLSNSTVPCFHPPAMNMKMWAKKAVIHDMMLLWDPGMRSQYPSLTGWEEGVLNSCSVSPPRQTWWPKIATNLRSFCGE